MNTDSWAQVAAKALHESVKSRLREVGGCSVMLTGGRSANELYKAWARHPDFVSLFNVNFYFSDERCVPPDHRDSNYCLAMRTLFCFGVPTSCKVIRIPADHTNNEASAEFYEAQLPEQIDLLLLSLGEDGHIASLFPNSSALLETSRRIVFVRAPHPLVNRITITPVVINAASKVFVLAIGDLKVAVYERAKLEPKNILGMPARLLLNANWFFHKQ